MAQINTAKLIRNFHRWISILVGIQVILWVSGGLIMSLLDIDAVHGDHLRKPFPTPTIQLDAIAALSQHTHVKAAHAIHLASYPRGVFATIDSLNGTRYLIDPTTGLTPPALSQTEAEKIAQKFYNSEGSVQKTVWIEENSTEYRKRLPAWRVDFTDAEDTSFYIAADTGELLSVRNARWRLFDFVWMLHIMDYEDRSDFNHPLLIFFAASTLLFCFSGVYLTVQFCRRQFKRTKKTTQAVQA